jgi:hypothetical protein
MPRFRNENGVRIQFTPEDERARDIEEAAWSDGTNDRAFAKLREKRNSLLAATDWWALSDLSITDAQIAYRTQLRDLPANSPDPTDITWPTPP